MITKHKQIIDTLAKKYGRDNRYVRIVFKHYFKGVLYILKKRLSYRDNGSIYFYQKLTRKIQRLRKKAQ